MTILKKQQQIIEWLNKQNISNFELIENEQYGYVVNVSGDVDLYGTGISSIPIKFNEVKGSFNCANNSLKTLEGSPETVYGSFLCHHNMLVSLEFCPQEVRGYFECSHNKLESLLGAPDALSDSFICSNNELTSLRGSPTTIDGCFNCSNNNIKNLEDFPTFVKRKVYLSGNNRLGILQDEQDFEPLYKEHTKQFRIKNMKSLTTKLNITIPMSNIISIPKKAKC